MVARGVVGDDIEEDGEAVHHRGGAGCGQTDQLLLPGVPGPGCLSHPVRFGMRSEASTTAARQLMVEYIWDFDLRLSRCLYKRGGD